MTGGISVDENELWDTGDVMFFEGRNRLRPEDFGLACETSSAALVRGLVRPEA